MGEAPADDPAACVPREVMLSHLTEKTACHTLDTV